jgi:hypothetical protein
MGLERPATALRWWGVDAIAVGGQHVDGGTMHLGHQGRHHATRQQCHLALLDAKRGRLHRQWVACGGRGDWRQEGLHGRKRWGEMPQEPAGTHQPLRPAHLVRIQQIGQLLHQGRQWQEFSQAEALEPGAETRARTAAPGCSASGFEELAKFDAGWTGGFTGPTAQAEVQLRKNLACFQVAIGHRLHQVNAPAW